MKLIRCENPADLGARAASQAAGALRHAVERDGCARVVLSTGASQFDTLSHLVREDVDWTKVEMFHLDEYVGLSDGHPASFRRYLRERFTSLVPLKSAHFVDGDPASIPELTKRLRAAPIHLGLIGIGENAHIAFNDPPADFETEEAYLVVKLAERCRRQQVGEGWFSGVDEVPREAISMSPKQILRCEALISCVPYAVKAEAVRLTLSSPLSPDVPATLLKTHPDWTMYIDRDSGALLEA